jgi:anaerobic ribonucleoside-triphosphate reductase activating protein
MRYAQYYPCDFTNGEGVRCTLFVTGCLHGCKGCHNASTWNPNRGAEFNEAMTLQILSDLRERDGLSLSGGDPLFPKNRDAITELCRRVKAERPDKTIWLWTGYRFEDICDLEVVRYLDVVIDGKFEQGNLTLQPWRGSNNQRLFRRVAGSSPDRAPTFLPDVQ